jgi:hypothetical protein
MLKLHNKNRNKLRGRLLHFFFFKKPTENKKPQTMNDITVKAVHTELRINWNPE